MLLSAAVMVEGAFVLADRSRKAELSMLGAELQLPPTVSIGLYGGS